MSLVFSSTETHTTLINAHETCPSKQQNQSLCLSITRAWNSPWSSFHQTRVSKNDLRPAKSNTNGPMVFFPQENSPSNHDWTNMVQVPNSNNCSKKAMGRMWHFSFKSKMERMTHCLGLWVFPQFSLPLQWPCPLHSSLSPSFPHFPGPPLPERTSLGVAEQQKQHFSLILLGSLHG